MREINITLGLLGVSCADTRLGQAGDAAVTQINLNVSALADGLTSPTYDLYYGIPGGTVLKAADTLTATDGVIAWTVPASACLACGDVRLQLDVLADGKRRRSAVWTMTVGEGMSASGSAPSAVSTWLDEVATAISSALAVAGAMSNDVTVNVEAGETASGTGSLTEDGLTLNLVVPTLQGAPGDDGVSAGFGTPTASIEALAAGETPEVTIETSGADTSKVFAFTFKIPRGATGHSVGSIYLKSGNHAAGTTDVYGIKLDDTAETEIGTISVYNGADGQGSGDMLKSAYDTNNNGVVDNAEQLGGHSAGYYATAAEIATLSDALAGKQPTGSYLTTAAKGAAGGVAELDSSGRVPSAQLPSYVDDVLEYAATDSFPATGEVGKIYVATGSNKTYRWSGSGYVEISASIALGETSGTAYRGDRGKTAYDHSQADHVPMTHATRHATGGADAITPSDIGAAAASHTHAVADVTGAVRLLTYTATLEVASWGSTSKQQSVAVSGLLTTDTVFAAAAPDSLTDYGSAGIYCSAQASGSLTFTCTTIPTVALTVNIAVWR